MIAGRATDLYRSTNSASGFHAPEVVAPVSDDGQRRSTGPPPRWVVPIGASAGGIPPSLAAIFYHLPPWAVVAIALGAPLIGAASYVIIAFADRRTVCATEVSRASRETAVEQGHRETLRSCIEGRDAAVAMECIDRDGGRWAISVEAAAQQQTLAPAREVDRRRAAG